MPFLLIDKPAGITSHDVVDRVRKITGERTVGHAGTLDPFATGLLIVAVGRDSTKKIAQYVGLGKEYEAEIVLGATTETLDPEGTVVMMNTKSGQPIILDPDELNTALQKLTGELQQIPPMHSAIKVKGQKLYELARQGKEIPREPRAVRVDTFEVLSGPITKNQELPLTLSTRIVCSSGTYIRALARDLGELLGTGGYLSALRRTKIGNFKVDEAAKLETLSPENWRQQAKNLV